MKRLATIIFAVVLASAGLGSGTAAAQDFGLENFDVTYNNADASPASQAGSHPFGVTTSFNVSFEAVPEHGNVPSGEAKDVTIALPPGVIGDVRATPRCAGADFTDFPRTAPFPGTEIYHTHCSNGSAVGVATTKFATGTNEFQYSTSALYNLLPPQGMVGQLGFVTFGGLAITVNLRLNPLPPYNVIATANDVPQPLRFFGSSVTVWGNPSDPAHDPERGHCLFVAALPFPQPISLGSCETDRTGRPFLTMPTSCSGPAGSSIQLNSWQNPAGEIFANSATSLNVSGCERLFFEPGVDAVPATRQAESSSGLDFNVDFRDEGLTSANGVAQSDIKNAVVTLPEGMTINPSAATGLAACDPAAFERETLDAEPGQGCPEASKVGNVEVETPLLEGTVLHGSLYVASQFRNPFNSLLAIYMVIKDPQLGILIKLPGKIVPDERTGQLVTTFGEPPFEVPQVPFSHFNFHFREGPRAPLTTPLTCGNYSAVASFTPWANPSAPLATQSSFAIDSGPGGGPCPPAGGSPLRPGFDAGTVAPVAGAYSPFVFKLSRDNGSQQLRSIDATLPEGLLGKLAGVSECSDAQIAAAAARSGAGEGAQELANPSCPSNSLVGTVNVGAGSGTPTFVQGKAYLAGPYKGAPLSLAIVTPAIAGPFDLGNVVVRTALYVDETTTQIHAVSDPIPTILHGIPLSLRSIALNMDRPEFTLNPTNCNAKQVVGSASSVLGQTAPLASRFQVGGCAGLNFKPKLKIQFKGHSKRSGNPAVKAVLTQSRGQAGIAGVTTVLPKSEFLDNAHVNNPCTRVQFSADACPPKSVLGRAKAWSPLLDKPLVGPVYFRSNGGERELPDLVIALHGQIDVTLVGFIDSVKKKGQEVSRVRTRFVNVPDAPVSRFVLELSGGKKGLLENSINLCKGKLRSTVKMDGQNGRVHDSSPVVKVACGKKDKGAKHHKGGKKRTR
jgi:hypothetical protein